MKTTLHHAWAIGRNRLRPLRAADRRAGAWVLRRIGATGYIALLLAALLGGALSWLTLARAIEQPLLQTIAEREREWRQGGELMAAIDAVATALDATPKERMLPFYGTAVGGYKLSRLDLPDGSRALFGLRGGDDLTVNIAAVTPGTVTLATGLSDESCARVFDHYPRALWDRTTVTVTGRAREGVERTHTLSFPATLHDRFEACLGKEWASLRIAVRRKGGSGPEDAAPE